MPYFHFRQNNSGGSFDTDEAKGIAPDVWIEARDADEANSRALEIGLYFNGVDAGSDCDCCGDRWYRASEYDAKLAPDLPSSGAFVRFVGRGGMYIHRLDGSIRTLVEKPIFPEHPER